MPGFLIIGCGMIARFHARALADVPGTQLRAVVSRSIAAQSEREGVLGAEVLLLVPGREEATAARAAEGILREMEAGLTGFTFAIGRSRIAEDPTELPRAASEALWQRQEKQGESTQRNTNCNPAGSLLL